MKRWGGCIAADGMMCGCPSIPPSPVAMVLLILQLGANGGLSAVGSFFERKREREQRTKMDRLFAFRRKERDGVRDIWV